VVSLYQMDLDRTLFLLRSYLRLRLQKVGRSETRSAEKGPILITELLPI